MSAHATRGGCMQRTRGYAVCPFPDALCQSTAKGVNCGAQERDDTTARYVCVGLAAASREGRGQLRTPITLRRLLGTPVSVCRTRPIVARL